MQQASGTEAFARPKFRHDHLVAEPIEDNGAKFIDVGDPDTGSMFRFFEIEFAIACGMDGSRDVPQLITWAKEELGLLPTAAEIRNVIAQLGNLGYLDMTAAARAAAGEPVSAQPIAIAPARISEPPRRLVSEPGRKVDDDLAPGVVVAAPSKQPLPTAADVELGHAGVVEREAPPAQDTIPTADFALGASGTTVPKTPRLPVEDVPLGAPGRSPTPIPIAATDVSLDLSDHMAVRRDDVKEAVRASKVMTAVDIPKDLQAVLDEPTNVDPVVRVPEPKPVAKQSKPLAKPVAKPEPVKQAEAKAKPVEKQPVVTKPVEKAKKPAEKQPIAPPAPQSRTTTRLIVLFLLLLLAFGGYMVWKYVIKKSNEDAGKTGLIQQPITPPTPVKKDPDPPKPEPVKLSAETPAPIELKAPAAGVIEAIDPAKSVKRGAIILFLAGGKAAQAQANGPQGEYDRVAKEIVTHKAELEKAKAEAPTKVPDLEKKLVEREKSLTQKKAVLDPKLVALDKLVVRAPADGDLTVSAKVGKFNAEDVLFTIAPAPVLAATFKPDANKDVKAGSSVYVALKGSEAARRLTCKATQVDDKGIKVECPNEPNVAGVEVSLEGQAPEAEVPAPPPPAPTPAPVPAPQPKPAIVPRPRPPQPKPADPKPADPKPADPPPADPKPADPKPADPPPPAP